MITIINYSDKSIALVGKETIDIKDKLKELGGKYNSRLKCGAGWIFSNKQLSKIKFAFMNSRIPYKMEDEETKEDEPSSPAPEIVFIDDDKNDDDKYKELEKKYDDLLNKFQELENKVKLISIKLKSKKKVEIEDEETKE